MSIELKNVSYTYMPGTPMERQALHDISLTIREGTFTAIAGHTGSGKSTLIQHLNGLLQPTDGTVLVDGVNINARDRQGRGAAKLARGSVGMVFQYPEQQLFEETVAADVAFGPRNQGLSGEVLEQRVQTALALAGLDYEAFGSQSPFQLSGGQKRRVAIAGVLAMQPRYLVLDEPTAGLDPRGREALMETVAKLRQGSGDCPPMTIIFVSHSMDDILRLADELVVLDRGRLVLSGSPEVVFREKDVLREAGLEAPELTVLLDSLRAAGLPVPAGARNRREAAAAIRQALLSHKEAGLC